MPRRALSLALALLAGCTDGLAPHDAGFFFDDAEPGQDRGAPDLGTPDLGIRDATPADARVDGGGGRDALPRDANPNVDNWIVASSVADGDTIRLDAGPLAPLSPDGRPLAGTLVRFLGVDAPEIAHPPEVADCWGDEAHRANRDLLLGRRIRLEYDPAHEVRDPFDRLLAYIVVEEDGTVANQWLIRNGHARSYRAFNHRDRSLYNRLEAEAEAAGLGLWSGCP